MNNAHASNVTARSLTPSVIARYLFESRVAIETIARTRGVLVIGLLLVLVSSFARNYDGADLLHEPHVMTHGVVVSTLNSFIIYCLVSFGVGKAARATVPFWSGYATFLALFWLTSPMAWLYAVPYEHFLSPVEAISANGWTLALVSVWRVAIITRVMAVLWNVRHRLILPIVLVFSSVSLAIASAYAPVPVVDFMGGMQHSHEEQKLASMNLLVGFWSVVLTPIFAIAALICVGALRRSDARWSVVQTKAGVIAPSTWGVLAMLAVLVVAGLVIMQPAQRRRHNAEELLRASKVSEAFAYMSRFNRSDFPPIWDPPPRRAYRESAPAMSAIREALKARDVDAWVRERFLAKSWKDACDVAFTRRARADMPQAIAEQFQANQTYDGAENFSEDSREVLRFHLLHDDRFSDEDREVVKAWLGESTEKGKHK